MSLVEGLLSRAALGDSKAQRDVRIRIDGRVGASDASASLAIDHGLAREILQAAHDEDDDPPPG
jgi:hypothetical protein